MKRFYLKQVNIIWKAAEGSAQSRPKEQAEELAKKLRGKFTVVVGCEPDDCTEDTTTEGILWLTDSPEMIRELTGRQLPVMAWLHEGNRHHSFAGVRYAVEEPQELEADFFEKIFRRFQGIPWEIAETKRCVIRETTVEDVDSFVRIYSQPEMTKYTDAFCMEPHKEREHVKEYIEKVYEFFGFGVWTVLWKETGEVIGRVGFEQPFAGVAEEYEESEEKEALLSLGYMIARPWQGKGIAQEVCRAVIDFAREELEVSKVQVVIDEENQPSLRLARRLGFKEWKVVTAKGIRYWRGYL